MQLPFGLSRIFGTDKPPRVRSYDGAAGGRRWSPGAETAVQLAAINAARGPVGRRARYLANNNALAASAADVWQSALAGTGIKGQSAIKDEAPRLAVNAAFEAWTDEADADGLVDFYGLQALAVSRMVIDGESFIHMRVDDLGRLTLRIFDAEQVDAAFHQEMADGARIIAGVEFGTDGKRVAYHVFRERPGLPIATMFDRVRIPAEDIIHLFRPLVAGQVRGLSWFAPILLRLHDYDKASDAQLVRQQISALFAGFVTRGTPEDYGDETDVFGATGDEDGAGLASLEPGTMQYLPEGTDVKFSSPAEIGAEAIDFLRVTAREISSGLGIPYELMTGDLSQTNYSSARVGLVEFRRRVEALQHNIVVFQFCRRVWQRFVTIEVLSGRLDAPGFELSPAAWLSARWITPRMPWVDPAKDAVAEQTAIDAGLMSRRQAVAARGYDLEELDREIADDNARAAAIGLRFGLQSKEAPNVAA